MGKTMAARLFGSDIGAVPTQMAFGTVTGSIATSGDTTLGSQVDTLDFDSSEISARSMTFECVMPTGSPATQPVWIREVGVITDEGSLWNHDTVVDLCKTNDALLEQMLTFRFKQRSV